MCGYKWVAMLEDLTQAFVHICACVSVWVPWVGSDRGEQQKYL